MVRKNIVDSLAANVHVRLLVFIGSDGPEDVRGEESEQPVPVCSREERIARFSNVSQNQTTDLILHFHLNVLAYCETRIIVEEGWWIVTVFHRFVEDLLKLLGCGLHSPHRLLGTPPFAA